MLSAADVAKRCSVLMMPLITLLCMVYGSVVEKASALRLGPSSSPLHYDSRAMMQEGESEVDGAESDGEQSHSSVPPAAAALPGGGALAGAASGNLASLTSGSLCDLEAALDAGADSAQRLRDASLSESQALAVEVTSKVDGILAQCSDLDRAVKEVDLGVDEEPLSGVRHSRVDVLCMRRCCSSDGVAASGATAAQPSCSLALCKGVGLPVRLLCCWPAFMHSCSLLRQICYALSAAERSVVPPRSRRS